MIEKTKLYFRNKIRCSSENTIELLGRHRVRKCKIYLKGKGNRLIIHPDVNIYGSIIEIDGNNCVLSIGRNTIIGESCYISCRENGTKLYIGDGCMFSRNSKIMTSDGHDILSDGERINIARNITVGRHVWLSDTVTVLKGVEIGSDSVIGIGSIVTSSIPANVVAAGVPAKIVKQNICWREEITFL